MNLYDVHALMCSFHSGAYVGIRGEWGRNSIKMYNSLKIERWAREEKKTMPSQKPQTCFIMPPNDLEIKENYMPRVYTLLALNIL